MTTSYDEFALAAAKAATSKGHADTDNLRELLIWTTCTTTSGLIEDYFRQHRSDEKLLDVLIEIALEGDEMGDAPWAAANTAVDFPAEMLQKHRTALVTLSNHEWMYLHIPAREALTKIDFIA
jgi:hypothetical protein